MEVTRTVTFVKPVPIPNNLPLDRFKGAVEVGAGIVQFDHLFHEGGPRFSVVVPLSNVLGIVTDYTQEA